MAPTADNSETSPDKNTEIVSLISNEDLRRLIEVSPLPAFVADRDGTCICLNSAFSRFLAYEPEEFSNKKIADLLAIDEPLRLDYVNQQIRNGRESHGSWEFLRKDGNSIWGDVAWRNVGDKSRLFFINDSTKRKLAEQSFLEAEIKRWQSQRIEALGRLAGGIAHDFNNFLAVILLHVDILNLQLPDESPIRARVNDIKEVSNGVAETVRQLLAFGRKQPMNLSPLVLNEVIKKFIDESRLLADATIKIDMSFDPELGICFVDQGQIVQVLKILVANSKDAMPNGGTLMIETSNLLLERDSAHKAQPSGSYIQIIIADDGVGMDSITEDYIFEPFFSTKETDKGAGLALAMVYGIVKQLKGFIWVESEIDKGTTFKIQFPRIDQPAVGTETIEQLRSTELENKTVLLVEDEEAVRRITAEFLKMSGYLVLEASSGMEALEIGQSYFKPIHLLLTDYSMPLMNGKDVAEKITKIHPETSVLFMSGNIENVIPDDINLEEPINFIGKPFSSSKLALRVREILKT